MRIGRHVGNNACHFKMLFGCRRAEGQDFAQRLRLAEITVGGTFRQHGGIGAGQLAVSLPFQNGETEEVEKGRFGKTIAAFGELLILVGNHLLPVLGGQPDELFDARYLPAHHRTVAECSRRPVIRQRCSLIQTAFDTVHAVAVMERVVAQFETDIEQNQQGGRDTHGQAKDINHRK